MISDFISGIKSSHLKKERKDVFLFLFSLKLHFQFIARDQNYLKQKIIQNILRVDSNSEKKTF